MSQRSINILLSIDRCIIGGAEQQFLELVKGLDKKRFHPVVVSLFAGGDLEPQVRSVPGIEYICLNKKGKFDLTPLWDVYRLLGKKKIDVIQPFLTPATFFTLIPAVLRRTPVKIVTERGARRKLSAGHALYLRIEDLFTRFADWIVPNSGAGRDYLISRGINPSRIKVIYNGIDIQRLHPDPEKVSQIRAAMNVPKDGAVVGVSASLTPVKDHTSFLEAASLVARELPHTRFALLGDGSLRPDLERLAGELGIDSEVFFLGNQTEVSSYIDAFDVACLSSSEMEGCSNSILEAMALGKPVIATDTGGNRELVQDGMNGIIVPTKSPAQLAEAILTCLRQPELTSDMGQHGKAMISNKFSIPLMVQQYERLYEDTLRRKHPAAPEVDA